MSKLFAKPTSSHIISFEQLHDSLVKIMLHYGVPKSQAIITAEVLIEGDLKGYKTHGVERIFQILEGFKKKTIDPNSVSEMIKEDVSIAVIDGKNSLGYPVGKMAMELAIEKAYKSGVGIVGTINCSHLGILSYYAELASKRECVGIVMTTSSPAVVLKGGRIKTLGTNPLCYSIPHAEFPITADFSTSKVSRGKIYEYLEENKSIPSDWAVDNKGMSTQCPIEALEGGLQPMDDGVKGNLLSLLISILAGHLIGGVINSEVKGTRDMNEKPNKGDFFMALSVKNFTGNDSFSRQTEELIKMINEQNCEFRIPGSLSYQNKKNNHLTGFVLTNKLRNLFDQYELL